MRSVALKPLKREWSMSSSCADLMWMREEERRRTQCHYSSRSLDLNHSDRLNGELWCTVLWPYSLFREIFHAIWVVWGNAKFGAKFGALSQNLGILWSSRAVFT